MTRAVAAALWILLAARVHAQAFDELVTLYRYDRAAPLNAKQKELPAHGTGYKLYSLTYDLPKVGHMSGYLVEPDGTGRRPAIVWMHSGGPIQFLGEAVWMARAGVVSILVGQSERKGDAFLAPPYLEALRREKAARGAPFCASSQKDTPTGTPEQARDQMIADVVGLRRAADLLESRKDVDPSRVAIVGHSYGAMMGAVAASIDNRFRAAVFECGLLGMSIHIGTSPGPWAAGVRKELGEGLSHFLEVISVADDRNYIGHAPAIPKLFQSAWYDPGVPHKDAEDFFQAATGPKELKWYDTGHDVDAIGALADRARFLDRELRLGKVDRLLQQEMGGH